MKVYVQSHDRKWLMSTASCRARLLIKQNKAEVINRLPFSIRLKAQTTEYAQPIILGIDPGKTVGIVAIARKKNGSSVCLFAQELTTRSDAIKKKLKERRSLRRGRRNRNTRYRKPRFQKFSPVNSSII